MVSLSFLQLQIGVVIVVGLIAYQYRSLRKYRSRLPPGPPCLPIVGNLLDLPPKGTPEFLHWFKHKDTYGPISSVTVMGQTLVVFHDKEAANVIMGKKATKTSGRPFLHFASLCGFTNFLITHQYNDTYRKHRKLVHQQIGTKSLSAAFNPVQEQEATRFVLRTLDDPTNMMKHLKTLAAAVILQITYGYSIEPQKPDPLVNLIENAMKHLSLAFVPLSWTVDSIPALARLPDWFPCTSFKKTAREWKATNETAAEIPFSFVRRQMSTGKYRKSYVSNLLGQSMIENKNDPKSAASDEEAIRWTAVSLYAAGSDSTVAILSSFVLAMIMFPEAQRRAQEEIDRAVGNDRLPTLEDRENLPFISGVVKEAWRWNPVGPMGLAHRADEDIEYDKYLIPKGAYLLPSLWWFLHDPKDYSDPERYKPERYMDPLNEPDPADVAFGYGRRSCAGRYFADASVFVTVAKTLALFNIEKALDVHGNPIDATLGHIPGMINWPKEFAYRIVPRGAHHVELLRRVGREQRFEESDSGMLDMPSV